MARKKSRFARRSQSETAQRYNMSMAARCAGESDLDYYKRMSKSANERLRQIEKLSSQQHYRGAQKYAYANAMYDIEAITGTDRKRFPTGIPKTQSGEVNQAELHRRMNALQRFIESPTSTKSGIKAIYKERAKTVNESLGLQGRDRFTWEDLANFYENEKAVETSKDKGSDTVLRSLGALKRISNDPEKIKAAKEGNIKISNDFVIDRVAKELLKEGINPSEFFKNKK